MSGKIIGVTVGSPLPKPNLMQNDPKKGDYVKGKEEFVALFGVGGSGGGSNGVSATHSWNGTVLTITSASGTSSADLRGEKGDKGDTGETGPQGPAGPQGEKGEKGDARKYGKLVVFGDSVGEGVNNDNYSFVDMLEESGLFSSVVKACVGSACIGPYQVDNSASGYDLNSQIERYASDVQDADIILLEYGANDVAAVINGKVQMGTIYDDATATTVNGYTQKALDRIYALNPNAKLHWVNILAPDWDYMNLICGIEFADNALLFTATVLRRCFTSGMPVIKSHYVSPNYLSSDGIHPNTAGHKHIAYLIVGGLFVSNYVFPRERVVTMEGVPWGSTFTVNATHANLKNLIDAGVHTRMNWAIADAGTIINAEMPLVNSNDYYVAFGSTAYSGFNSYPSYNEVQISASGSVSLKTYEIGSVQ